MFRILSIDGGGVRGIFPAYVLKQLSDTLDGQSLRDVFDLVIGTSTGGIIAAAVAQDIPLQRVVELYEQEAPAIFGRKHVFNGSGIIRSRYPAEPLRSLIGSIFGDVTMKDVPGRLVLPCTDVSNGNVFVIKSAYLPTFVRDLDIRLADAVAATTAAPMFFDPIKVKEYLLADGAMWANNPSMVAYTEAVGKLGVKADSVRILSIGTGTGEEYYGSRGRPAGVGLGHGLENAPARKHVLESAVTRGREQHVSAAGRSLQARHV
jgi:patatin-like phospholipase/acyl hydrolase